MPQASEEKIDAIYEGMNSASVTSSGSILLLCRLSSSRKASIIAQGKAGSCEMFSLINQRSRTLDLASGGRGSRAARSKLAGGHVLHWDRGSVISHIVAFEIVQIA